MNRGLLGILFATIATAVAFVWWSRGDALVVDPRESMPSGEPSFAASAKVRPRVERVELKAEDPPISSMTPAEDRSDAMKTAGHEVPFDASVLLDSELAAGVAEEMVSAAEAHWRMYQSSIDLKEDDTHRHHMDFLFSAWPDISQLISDKRVEVAIYPAPNRGAIQGAGSITYSYRLVEDVLAAAFHLPSWRVSITFTDLTYQPELRKRIADSAAKGVDDSRARRGQNK